MVGKRKLLKICVITYPFGKKTKPVLLFNLLEIFESIADRLYVITGNIPADEIPNNRKYHLINFKMEKELRRHLPMYIAFPIWLFNYIIGQIKMSNNLLKVSKNIDIVIFFLGYNFLLPMLTAKVLRKKTVMIVTESSKSAKIAYNKVFYYISRIMEKLSYTLSDQLIVDINVESENQIHQFGLEKYRNKVSFGGALPVDVNSFRINKKLKDRRNIIGYIGRHSPEKGVMNFAKAIPLILKERNDLEFIIGSGGPLFEKIKDELKENGSYDKVTFTGWVPREKLPDYFNKMKLIVVPSYTETIPNVILEAMACGTPVVASPVDAIPDLIRDGDNGFLMENNSPECIAKNVIRTLDDPRLDEIVKNAYNLIQREYTYEVVVENYRKLLMGKE